MVTLEEIVDIWRRRKTAAGPAVRRMGEVQRMYNGDVIVPLPELNRDEQSSVANRVRQGLDQFGDRIGSTLPDLDCPPLRPGITLSVNRADDRRRALLGWWEASRMNLILRQRARHLQGYGSSPVQVRWDPMLEVPRWVPRSPLCTFPSQLSTIADLVPDDCVVEMSQTLGFVKQRYPESWMRLAEPGTARIDLDRKVTLLEWVDADWCVLGGYADDNTDPYGSKSVRMVELERYPNRAGCCTITIPRMVSLDRDHGQFDGMLGMFQTEAMLMALAIIATKKGVFADEWLIANPGEEPQIVQVPDSMNGEPGILRGGQLVPRGVDPQFQTNITIDRLAEAQRMQAGLASELSGVASSNIRTGRRGSQVLGAVIDFPIQAAQEALASSMVDEHKHAIALVKSYSGPKTFYVSWPKAKGFVTYDPAVTFETDQTIVTYPLTGVDAQGLVIAGMQRVGAGTMSKRTWMRIDPMVEDPDAEWASVVDEQITQAFLASVEQLAANPQGPWQPADFARLHQLIVVDRLPIYEASAKVHAEAQARQATPAPTPEAAQPGLSMPGQGMEQPSIGPSPDQQGLASLLNTLRSQRPASPAAA